MKWTKKKLCLVILAALLCGAVQTYCLVKTVNFILVFPYVGTPTYSQEKYGSFTPEDTYSYDGKLIAHQRIEKGIGIPDTARMVIVDIKDSKTGKLVGSFSPARAMDFWGICWENDSYDIWIQSGDIGIYCYRYEDGEWNRDTSHPERPDYIVSKYD